MSPLFILGGLALGIAIGIVSCMVGIGGGVLLIPALIYFYGMSQIKAQGTSIATLLFPIGCLAFLKYYKAGHVDVKLATLVAIGFIVGGYFGGAWAQHLSPMVLRRSFAALLVLVAAKLMFER
jgi:uncharacterized membrane protein YfcA